MVIFHTGNKLSEGGIQYVTKEIIFALKSNSHKAYICEVIFKSKVLVFLCFLYFSLFTKRDLIFCHAWLAKILFFFKGQNRIFVFLHGVEVWRDLGYFGKCSLNKVDMFLVNSEFTWMKFLAFNPVFSKSHSRIVHLGLDSSTNIIHRPSITPIAVILGRLSKSEDYKGHKQLIKVWEKIRTKIQGAELWIVGDGDQICDLQNLAQITKGIKFLGKVSQEEKNEAITKSRCLVMPSKGEGFGLVYLEAMRLGRPCLVSNQDAGREVVNPPECGLSVDPDNTEQMFDALVKLLVLDASWEEMSKNAKKRYDNYFTSKHFHKRFIEALN